MTKSKNEIVLYQSGDEVNLEVLILDETVWLTQEQIATLFGTQRPAVTKHLGNIFKSGELHTDSVCSILELTAADGKTYKTKHYNLDAIISVGYRVNSINATRFRQWATGVLRDYILHGYAVNQRFENIERRLGDMENKVDFFVRTSLPPVEGVFYEGQIFGAYTFACDLVKHARYSLVLLDNYIDENVLMLMSKRGAGVSAKIYTAKISKALELDIKKHNAQYPPIKVSVLKTVHDRFLMVDETVYHIGASLKDLGKKLFAFSKLNMPATEILMNVLPETKRIQDN